MYLIPTRPSNIYDFDELISHNYTARERVAFGAQLLDQVQPGWEPAIDVSILDIHSCTKCVIGQIMGDYWAHLGPIFEAAGVDHLPHLFGFFALGRFGPDGPMLEAAWTDLIKARFDAGIDIHDKESA